MKVISKTDNFVSLAIQDGEAVTLKGSEGGELTMRVESECILNVYRKAKISPIQFE